MKKQYTKRQIQEAIDYWKGRLSELDEGVGLNQKTLDVRDGDFYITVNTANEIVIGSGQSYVKFHVDDASVHGLKWDRTEYPVAD